jgi:ribose 5-phosphate isomerase B
VKIAIASDHAGFALKSLLIQHLKEDGHEVLDLGTHSVESVDYPPFCAAAARAVVRGEVDRGIVLGGSGQGEQIAANKVHGARAALCHDLTTAQLARQHNDANVVSIGARQHSVEEATALVLEFLATPFSGDERHVRRIGLISDYERDRHRPAGGLPTGR